MAANTADAPQRLPYMAAKTSTYVTTLELTDPNATPSDPTLATSVGKQVQSWITQLKAFNKAFSLKTINDDDMLANNLPQDPAEVYRIVQYEVSPKKRRNITVICHLETMTPFREFKTPLIPWLQSNNMWMDRNQF